MSHSIPWPAVLSTAALLYIYHALTKRKHDQNPPGPKPLPIIGNLLDFPQTKPWEAFAKWKEQYGDIIYINMLGTPTVILNSMDACIELLEKRSAKYSGRPRMVMLDELVGFDYSVAVMDYSRRWRQYRQPFIQYFDENESFKYRDIQERYVYLFLQRLLATPDKFLSHIRLLFGETILDIVYGIKAEDNNQAFIQIAEKAMYVVAAAGTPGRFLVEDFPLLKHVPSWFPGAKFKRLAEEWYQDAQNAKDLPFAYMRKKMEKGVAEPCIVTSMLDQYSEVKETRTGEIPEEVIKGCAAIAYLAGADTTLSTVQTFFRLMANNQEVQHAAQTELSALLGSTPNRLPCLTDRDQLPFIAAIVKELIRCHNVFPLGFAHSLTEDDEFNGYILRKGTAVLPNIWHILRDPEIYPDPLAFKPQRWLINTPAGPKINPDVPDPTATFGFGRRLCPGRHLASNALFIIIACVLACFDIRPLDAQGQPADKVDEELTSGLLIYPVPFKVSITPRSSHLAQLIKDMEV